MGTLETGRENAFRFVQHVNELSRATRVIVVHADDRHRPWPWMKNPAWQNLVLDQLEHRATVEDAKFINGDAIDGLLFTAISVAGDHRIERLQLTDSLDGPIEDTPWRRFGARLQTMMPGLCWWCVGALLGAAVIATVLHYGKRERAAIETHSLEVPHAPQ